MSSSVLCAVLFRQAVLSIAQVETVSHQLRDLAAWCSQVADVFYEFTQVLSRGWWLDSGAAEDSGF